MSVDTLTISRRRLKQIISEVVTKQNLEHVILQLLGPEYKSRLEITGGETADDIDQVVQFKIQARDRAEANAISEKLAPIEGAQVNMSGMDKLGYMELADPTGPIEIDGKWFFAGGAVDFGTDAEEASQAKKGGPTLVNRDSTDAIDKRGWNRDAATAAHAASQQQSQAAQARSKGEVKNITATVFMTPEITAMTSNQNASDQDWWDAVSAEVVEKQRAKMRHEGWHFTDELKKDTAEAVKSVAKDRGIKTDVVDMKKFNAMLDDVWAEEARDDSGIFGETPTQVSAPVSESREYVRRLINQIIIEECLSKVD